MSTSAVRAVDSAAGIIVLLLLAIAVIGGQSDTSGRPGAVHADSQRQSQAWPRTTTLSGYQPGSLDSIEWLDMAPAALDMMPDLHQRDLRKNRAVSLDD
jgi:hypothetical protein